MSRWISWRSDEQLTGWACSQCDWTCELPALLSDPQARSAFDRLAAAKFKMHNCSDHKARSAPVQDSFAERARQLVIRGFNAKDAAEITMQEIEFENRDDPVTTEQAHRDATDFLRRVKGGLI